MAEAGRQYEINLAAVRAHDEALGNFSPLRHDSPSLYMVRWYDHPNYHSRKDAFAKASKAGRDILRTVQSALRAPDNPEASLALDASLDTFRDAFSTWLESTKLEDSTNTDTFKPALAAWSLTRWEHDQLELLTKGALQLEAGTQDLSNLMYL